MKSEIRELIGEWRIWLLIVALAVSFYALLPNPWAKGLVVNSVDEQSPFQGKIVKGTIIKRVDGEVVTQPSDLLRYENRTGVLKLQTSQGLKLVNVENQSLGITVGKAKKINLEFGTDLVGGVRVLLQPQFENVTNETVKDRKIANAISVLKTRLNVFGLKEMSIDKVDTLTGKYISISAPEADRSVVNELLNRKGYFEAYIPRTLTFNDTDTAQFGVGEQSFQFTREDGEIYPPQSDDPLKLNGTVEMNGVTFLVDNVSSSRVSFQAQIYDSEDIVEVFTAGKNSYIRKMRNSQGDMFYQFRFKVLVKKGGMKRFAKVTQNLEEGGFGQDCYLSQRIHYYLDKKKIDELNLPCSVQGKEFNPWIEGSEKTKEKALDDMRKLQSVMSSGKLPIELEQARVESVSPTVGRQALRTAGIAGVGALIAVALVISFRYRNPKVIVPVLVTSFSEVFIMLGGASLVGHTMNLPAIAGIIAAIGSSVDDQIVITSETLESGEKEKSKYSIQRRVKRAFFIVFVAAATTIVAMSTLAVMGASTMRGFAIMTIIGVLAGVLITRPAYGKIIEAIL